MLSDEELIKQRGEVHDILRRAMALYSERDAKYQGLWAEGGAQDNAFHLRHKAMRVFRMMELCELDEEGRPLTHINKLTEDAFDLINYTVFYIWCVEHCQMRPAAEGQSDHGHSAP